MKIFAKILVNFLVTSLFITSCSERTQIFENAHTPQPLPVGENSTWNLQILDINKYTEPKELICSDCSKNDLQDRLTLQDGYSYLEIAAKVINKTNGVRDVSDLKVGVLLSSGVYGCGGVTLGGSDFCLLAGITRGEKTYLYRGIDTQDFEEALSFLPGSPDGEIVKFIFITKKRDRYLDFYFDDLPAINIRK